MNSERFKWNASRTTLSDPEPIVCSVELDRGLPMRSGRGEGLITDLKRRTDAMADHAGRIAAARGALSSQVIRTPMTEIKGIKIKREDLQISGSFKWRGVLAQIGASHRRVHGLVCVSTGNTGKAVALAAHRRKIESHIFTAGEPPAKKRRFIETHGGTIYADSDSFSAAAMQAFSFAQYHEMIFVSPGASWSFVYGVASILPEILDEARDTSTLFVPIGGGGLVTGIGLALSGIAPPKPRLVGVQATNSPYVYHHYNRLNAAPTILETVADSLSGDLEPGALVLDLAREILDDVVLVSEEEMIEAVTDLKNLGISTEPGAAAAFAAARSCQTYVDESQVQPCAILSGGND